MSLIPLLPFRVKPERPSPTDLSDTLSDFKMQSEDMAIVIDICRDEIVCRSSKRMQRRRE